MKRLLLALVITVVLFGCTTAQYYTMLGGVDTSKVYVGMSQADFMEVAPRPDDINRTVSSSGTREQWVYHVGTYDTQYFYFEDGKLTSYQSSS